MRFHAILVSLCVSRRLQQNLSAEFFNSWAAVLKVHRHLSSKHRT